MKMNQLLSMNLPEVKEYRISNAKGKAYVMPAEGLARFDWKTLQARPAPFNFAIVKTVRAAFVEAVRGEYFARELTSIEAEAAKLAENDDAFFADARQLPAEGEAPREAYSEEEVKKARANLDEAKKRIDVIRNYVSPLAKESQSVTVKALVSALRAEAMPAKLAKPAEDVRAEAKLLCEVAARSFTPAEVEAARKVVDDKEGFPPAEVAEAEKTLLFHALAEGESQGVPNLKKLRELISVFIKAMWTACPAEGVQTQGFKASHALSVEVFQRIRTARKVTKKGNIRAAFASTNEIAREVVFAVFETLQARARAEAAEAEAKRKAAEKPAPEVKPAPAKK